MRLSVLELTTDDRTLKNETVLLKSSGCTPKKTTWVGKHFIAHSSPALFVSHNSSSCYSSRPALSCTKRTTRKTHYPSGQMCPILFYYLKATSDFLTKAKRKRFCFARRGIAQDSQDFASQSERLKKHCSLSFYFVRIKQLATGDSK